MVGKKLYPGIHVSHSFYQLVTIFTSFDYNLPVDPRDCSHGGELARLGGLARLGEIIFIARSYEIFYLSSIKKFLMSLRKACLIK